MDWCTAELFLATLMLLHWHNLSLDLNLLALEGFIAGLYIIPPALSLDRVWVCHVFLLPPDLANDRNLLV